MRCCGERRGCAATSPHSGLCAGVSSVCGFWPRTRPIQSASGGMRGTISRSVVRAHDGGLLPLRRRRATRKASSLVSLRLILSNKAKALALGWIFSCWLFGHQLEHLNARGATRTASGRSLRRAPTSRGSSSACRTGPCSRVLGAVLAWNVFTLLTYTASGGAACAWLRSLGLAARRGARRRPRVRARTVPRRAEHGPPARPDLALPAALAARDREAEAVLGRGRDHRDPALGAGEPRARRSPVLRRVRLRARTRAAGRASRGP